MPGIYQQTLNNSIRATGVGLHSGKKVFLTLHPSGPDTGITFVRTDLEQTVSIAASAVNVGTTTMATCLEQDGVQIRTIEHLMSAFAGLGIDNALVEVSSDELPIMDGSAAPFVFLLQSAGITVQSALKRFVRILQPIAYRHPADAGASNKDSAWVSLSPHEGFRLDYQLHYDHPVFARHSTRSMVDFSTMTYVREVSRARTFGFLADYEELRELNLARGGSLENAVVVDDYQILNDEGLRLEDEFPKHKILDAIGDLYLLGHPIIGEFSGHMSGHGHNNELLRALLAQPEAYEVITFADDATAPGGYAVPPLAAIA
jgi:UDP-3-O-[3-hydroxymyristoyl] N-acetylglucosamine deacetylase